MNPHQDRFSRLAQILETISPKKLSGMLLAFALPFCGIAQETPKPAQVLPPVEEPVQLLLISQTWKSPAPGAIGLPSFSAGFVRFATEDAIHEGPMLLVRPSIWAASWVPGTGESFSYFQRDADPLNYDMQADARGVAFVGRNRAGQHGIYHYSTNKIERTLVKAASTVPGLSTPFQRLRYPFVQGSRAIFLGESEGNLKGVYLALSNKIERIADTTMEAPGTTNKFYDFSYARLGEDGTAVFTGYSEFGSGIYAYRGDKLSRLVDRTSIEPRSATNYSGVLLVGYENGWAYFTSFGESVTLGRVRDDSSSIETLMDDSQPLPGETEPMGALNYASVDKGRILFEAAIEDNAYNLYVWDQGQVRVLARKGQLMESGTVLNVRAGLQSLSGTRFVCLLDTSRGEGDTFTRAVYLGDFGSKGSLAPLVKAQQQPSRPGWLKLGSAPIEVFARERSPGSSTNAPLVKLSDKP